MILWPSCFSDFDEWYSQLARLLDRAEPSVKTDCAALSEIERNAGLQIAATTPILPSWKKRFRSDRIKENNSGTRTSVAVTAKDRARNFRTGKRRAVKI